jgi:hypothetical protein
MEDPSNRNGSAPPSPNKGGRPALQTLRSIKRELAEVAAGIRNKTIEPKVGNACVYALSTLADIIKGADIEGALKRLEMRENRQAKADEEMTPQ